MPQTTLIKRKTSPPLKNSYTALLHAIRQTIEAGKIRATKAVERELVRSKWETGKLVLDHILFNKDRAGYGGQVLKRLSRDLGTSKTELEYMLKYARGNPIAPPAGQLSWAKERELLSVNQADERVSLARQASKKKWTRETLRKEITKLREAKQITVTKKPDPEKIPDIKPGQLGLYGICKMNGIWCRDLGFSTYQILKDQNQKTVSPPENKLYTYEADVTEVVDGDTYHCIIQLGFDMILEQRVRLRRLNAPELITRAGQQAKKVLQRILSSSVKRGGGLRWGARHGGQVSV